MNDEIKRTNNGSVEESFKKECLESFEYQKEQGVWDFYSERAFIENLFSTRLNFLVIVYSLFITGFVTTEETPYKALTLFLGFIIVSAFSLSVYRAYIKLDINLKILYRLPQKHVFPFIDKVVKEKKVRLWNVNPMLGWIIPLFMVLTFPLLGIALYYFR